MIHETKICKKCLKSYLFSSTDCDLCIDCVNKYPYFLSFIEEGFIGVDDVTFGRVEIYTNKESDGYAIDELRFLFKDNKLKNKEFYNFRDKWDFQNVTKIELKKVKKIIKENFYENRML